MEFYENISSYYDQIFPLKKETLSFLQDSLALKDKGGKVIDLACGSGSYSLALVDWAKEVFGYDLDTYMIDQANSKKKSDHITFKAMDMMMVGQQNHRDIDFVYCIGNSLVHLNGQEEIENLLVQIYQLLDKGGVLVLQIMNYDRVLDKDIRSLPTICNENEGVTFYRYYEPENDGIIFKSKLDIHKSDFNESFIQKVRLYPIRSTELVKLIEKVGFVDLELFGNFNGEVYESETSYGLIVRAKK